MVRDAPIPIAIWNGRTSMPSCECSPKESRPAAAGDTLICITTVSITGFAHGGEPGLPRSHPAARSRIRQTTPSSPNPKAPWWAPSMRTSQSKALPATSCCSEIHPGGFGVLRPAAFASRMLTAPRRPFPSGAAKRRRELRAFRRRGADSRNDQSNSLPDDAAAWLQCRLRPRQARGANRQSPTSPKVAPILGTVATQNTVVAERFFDEGGGMQLVIARAVRRTHQQGLGTGVAQTILRDLRFRAAGRRHGRRNRDLSWASVTAFRWIPFSVFCTRTHSEKSSSNPCCRRRCLQHAGDGTRRVAGASPLLQRRKVPPQIQRMRAEDLLGAVFPAATACQDNHRGDMYLDPPDHPS